MKQRCDGEEKKNHLTLSLQWHVYYKRRKYKEEMDMEMYIRNVQIELELINNSQPNECKFPFFLSFFSSIPFHLLAEAVPFPFFLF